MAGKLLFSVLLTGIVSGVVLQAFTVPADQQENHPPSVRIDLPADRSSFQWNGSINYRISVTDKENGNSAYEEIPAQEVLLKVAYFPDSMDAKKYLRSAMRASEPRGLSLIKVSSCFNCHAAGSKLIGPSFQLIAGKYPATKASEEALAKKLINGSIGTWGKVQMPPHPDLAVTDAKAMVSWILHNNKDPDLTFYPGLQGAFRSRQRPAGDVSKAMYVLTASYTDHGLKGGAGTSRKAEHTIVLKAR